MSEPLPSLDEVTAAIAAARGDAVAVITMTPLGFWGEPADTDYRLVGLMGSAAAIGLGVALGRPDRRVWVVDGDGSLLMRLGVLGAIADAAPPNLVHIVIDNGVYAVSGGQPVPGPIDWATLARGAGIASATACDTASDLRAALVDHDADGPRMVVARCARAHPPYPKETFARIAAAAEAERLRAVLAAT